jgi:membrane fusion protein, multidrug efflux system
MQNKRIIYLYIILLFTFSAQSCKKAIKQNQSGGAVPVTEYIVKPQKVSVYDSYPGTVTALNEVEVRSQVSGYVTGIYFKEGSQVTKGSKLYEIDQRKYKAAFEQANANVDIAGANLEKAQRDADRYTKLNEQNAIAKQVFDDASTYLQNSKMQLIAAKAALLNAESDYNYSLITAPFTGTIGFSMVKPGTFVNAGQTLLNTISSDDPIAVDFIVNEKSLPEFTRLSKTVPEKADSTFRITLPDNSLYPFNGQLSVIDRAVNSSTGTLKIRVVFPNHDKILRDGMNCRVKVLAESSGNQITIPFKSVVEQMGEYFVYLIDSMKVKQVKIELGTNLGEFIEVRQGLKPGDQIVFEGLQKLRNGSPVRTAGQPGKEER